MKKLGFKIWFLISMLIVSLLFIFAGTGLTKEGVKITSITVENNTLYDLGIRNGDIITSIDSTPINSFQEYTNILQGKFLSGEEKTTLVISGEEYIILTDKMPEMTIKDLEKTNLKLGLDLAGGARALIKAENKTLTQSEVNDLVDITQNRLNAFGLTDMRVSPVSDLSGENYMSIEIAGATPKDLRKIIGQQGKFEAIIGNQTVFVGGEKDIASVGRDAQSARITGCSQSTEGYYCNFAFTITLSPKAAQRQATITDNLSIIRDTDGQERLSEKLDLYLDDNLVNSLGISAGLKGRAETQISISGSGTGPNQEDALLAAKEEMHNLQTILMTGSLPYKLEIVKLDSISPNLGDEFINSILLVGIVAILVVSLIIFIRYRSWKSSLALIAITISEVIIVLGIAALIDWNLDLPGIAGILATIGTGIDDLIILLDESAKGYIMSLKEKLKRAFSIIMGAYFTTFVSLLPLIWAGAGMLKGFAITTIIGISVGVFITRPAFSEMIKRFRD